MSQICDAPWIKSMELWGVEEGEVFSTCDECKEDIYEGEEYYDFGTEIVCEGCGIKYLYKFRKVAW